MSGEPSLDDSGVQLQQQAVCGYDLEYIERLA